MSSKTKKCPFCGEEILAVAVKCRHCQSMLDGSNQSKNVKVTGVDPFAEIHAPIKGKSKGKITFIGKLGIVVGLLFVVFGFISLGSATFDIEMQNSLIIVLLGFGFIIASYLWARRPSKK